MEIEKPRKPSKIKALDELLSCWSMYFLKRFYTDWTGTRKHVCKRGFKTQREAKEYERTFTDQQNTTSDILFSSLVENYLEDMKHRLKPTTMENERFIIEGKLLPYFEKLRVCDIDTIKIRKWQNELLSYRDEEGKPCSQTYLKTVNNQPSALLNYAVAHYRLASNPCRAAGSMGKSRADEMNIWTQKQYEQFSNMVQKSSVKLAFDILFVTVYFVPVTGKNPCKICFANGFLLAATTFSYGLSSKC